MTIIITFLLLLFLELLYFRIADYYNIIDKPNSRSMHSTITIRGGGIIFFVSVLFFFIYSGFKYPLFFIGLSAVTVVSFLDDVFTLPNRYRLPFQFFAIIMIIYQLQLINHIGLFAMVSLLIVGVGIMNAYNFMDGVNGMTGGYSLVVINTLYIVNNYYTNFVENDFLYLLICSLVVFNFFNFRNKAKCFAGDVGSISMATIIIYLLLKLIFQTGEYIYILFLTIYGVDTILTIIHRFLIKENIFEAHRRHLFQVLVQKAKITHLQVASIYAILQFMINLTIINFIEKSSGIILSVSIIGSLIIVYVFIKRKFID